MSSLYNYYVFANHETGQQKNSFLHSIWSISTGFTKSNDEIAYAVKNQVTKSKKNPPSN